MDSSLENPLPRASLPPSPPQHMKTAVTTAETAADYLLASTSEHGDFFSNLKLQKLLYYAQGWHMAIFGRSLFADNIEAWIHGPVVASVYRKFKRYGSGPISQTEVEKPSLPAKTAGLIDEVAQKYGRFSAWELELMTHRETPWLNARAGCKQNENSSAMLDAAGITTFFKGLLNVEKAALS